MIANAPGATPAYSLGPLEERGKLFAAEGDLVYEGQLVGIHSKDNDLTVNVIKRSEEHTSELQSLMRISYAVFCLKKKKYEYNITNNKTSKVPQTRFQQL